MPKPDRNYFSYDGAQVGASSRVFDPLGDDYKKWGTEQPNGSYNPDWDDTLKFHRRQGLVFTDMTVVQAGREDGCDINQECVGNHFNYFCIPCGKQGLTFKGGCHNNVLAFWTFMVERETSYTTIDDLGNTVIHKVKLRPGKFVEAEFGNWSSRNFERCKGNVAIGWKRNDGKRVRYAGRFGCIPKFEGSHVKHVWWLSIGITIYWWAKWLLVKLGIIKP